MEAFLIAIDMPEGGKKRFQVALFEEGEVNSHMDVLTKKPLFSGFVTASSWLSVLLDGADPTAVFRK